MNAQSVEGEKPLTTYEKRIASGERVSISESPSMNALAPRHLSHRIRVIAHMAALGLSNREISGRTGYTEGRLSVILRTNEVIAEVEKTRREIFSRSDAQALVTMLPKAYETIWETLNDFNEKKALKVDTAFKVIERLQGKPKQSIDVGGTMLKDVFALLDRQASAFEKFAPRHETAVDVTNSGAPPSTDASRSDEVRPRGSASSASHSSPDPRASEYFTGEADAMEIAEGGEFTEFLDAFSGRLGSVPDKTKRKA